MGRANRRDFKKGVYDPRLVDVLDEVLREELDQARGRIIRRVAEELGIDPDLEKLEGGG